MCSIRSFVILLTAVLAVCFATAGNADDPKPAESGVPKGEVLKFTFDQSKVFPGTTRDYWVYVPKQYDPAKPAGVFSCLAVND